MSPRALGKQQQFDRENLIMDCALELIERDGIGVLTMDKLVAELPYSKGTVYNHFTSKEDLLLALCNRSMDVLATLFLKSEAFEGLLREKALAVFFAYMLYARLHPTQFMLVITAKSAQVTEKASCCRTDEHVQLESKLVDPILRIFEQALAEGVLCPPPGLSLEQLVFYCWSLGFGANALLLQGVDRCTTRSELVVEKEMLHGSNILFDGLGFQPATSEFDWSDTIQRLKRDIFFEEVKQLESHGVVLAI
ncbi:MAG TPA: TetR/AcrR family transcriptional regulator [Gammaproteobacteria bacterium]|nr:TetR/AcrR family transcriptional regulator [Gammaproteobacteria bacterium]